MTTTMSKTIVTGIFPNLVEMRNFFSSIPDNSQLYVTFYKNTSKDPRERDELTIRASWKD